MVKNFGPTHGADSIGFVWFFDGVTAATLGIHFGSLAVRQF